MGIEKAWISSIPLVRPRRRDPSRSIYFVAPEFLRLAIGAGLRRRAAARRTERDVIRDMRLLTRTCSSVPFAIIG